MYSTLTQITKHFDIKLNQNKQQLQATTAKSNNNKKTMIALKNADCGKMMIMIKWWRWNHILVWRRNCLAKDVKPTVCHLTQQITFFQTRRKTAYLNKHRLNGGGDKSEEEDETHLVWSKECLTKTVLFWNNIDKKTSLTDGKHTKKKPFECSVCKKFTFGLK